MRECSVVMGLDFVLYLDDGDGYTNLIHVTKLHKTIHMYAHTNECMLNGEI